MKTYAIDIETFTPGLAPNGDIRLTDCRLVAVTVTGWHAARKRARVELAKGKLGRCVILRDATGKGRRV